ncbi:thioredoxin domain-containing protein 15-like [Clavelina lepadiformis]|uniref:Thioredoxin domain-containing protein n=1 Tax=Clavelina lepadiformis TaxID=159417 RepID=A0ABP0FLU0_CLALP
MNSSNICPVELEYYGNKLCSADLANNIHSNAPINSTDDKLLCHNMTYDRSTFSEVLLFNSTQLLAHLDTHSSGMCAVVLFYAFWCPLSMQMAPYFNALSRTFTGVPFIAIEVKSQFNIFASSQLKYGTIAVPNLIIFNGVRAIGRYNDSVVDMDSLVKFLGLFMELNAGNADICENEKNCITRNVYGITEQDYVGPLPVKYEESTDWLLFISCAYLLFVLYRKLKKFKLL